MRAVFALTALLGCLVLPTATAQGTNLSLTVTELPTGNVSTNDTFYLEKFVVQVRGSNFICRAASHFDVLFEPTMKAAAAQSVSSTNRTVAFVADPVRLPISAGEYASAPYDQSLEAGLEVRPSAIPYGGLEVPVSLKATLQPNNECVSADGLGSLTQTKEFTVQFRRGTEPAPVTPTPAMPGPGLFLAASALLAGLALTRGRRAA